MFKRTEEQIAFFKHIPKKGAFQIDFDFWYLCLLLGVGAGRKEQGGASVDMIARFPDRYSGVENLLIAMVIRAELVEKGIEPTDRASVKQVVDKLLDPSNRPFLSPAGFKVFNEYSTGGFEILSEYFSQLKPDDPATFLIKYGLLVQEVFEESKVW